YRLCSYLPYTIYFHLRSLPSLPTRRSSDLRCCPRSRPPAAAIETKTGRADGSARCFRRRRCAARRTHRRGSLRPARGLRGLHLRSEEHTSELQSRGHLVCRLLLEKKKKKHI